MRNLNELPPDLPAPVDDGACDHLQGLGVPEVTLSSTGGGRVNLAEASRGPCVLFFYPRTGVPEAPARPEWDLIPGARGCTPQCCGFRDAHEDFRKLGVAVFGVSSQGTRYQQEFARRARIPYEILSDEDFALTGALGLPTFEFNGMRLIKRLALFAREGTIQRVWYPVFPPDGNAGKVLGWLEATGTGRLRVRPLGPETQDDFFRMRRHESCDWCFCVAWHVPTWEGWTERSAAENRALRQRLLDEGRHDGYLLYAGDEPVGWCQCAPLDWFPKLIGQMGLGAEPPGTYVIGCLEILPERRKQGLSRTLLQKVLAGLRGKGAARVLAIPRTGRHEDGKVWTGPSALFESCGFKALKAVGDRHVMALELAGPLPS